MNVTVTLTHAEAVALAGSVPSGDLAIAKNKLYAAIEAAERHEATQIGQRIADEARRAKRVSARDRFEAEADRLRLGSTQREVLRSLVGRSYPGGWVWDTHSNTVRMLEGLVKKGLAAKRTVRPVRPVMGRPTAGSPITRYEATDAGREVVGDWTN